MTVSSVETFTEEFVGVWAEGYPFQPHEQTKRIIRFAQQHGFELAFDLDEAYASFLSWDYQEFEAIAEVRDEAIDYLQSMSNDKVVWGYDNTQDNHFGLWLKN